MGQVYLKGNAVIKGKIIGLPPPRLLVNMEGKLWDSVIKCRANVLQTWRGPHGGLAYWMVQYLAWLHDEYNQHNMRGYKCQLGTVPVM